MFQILLLLPAGTSLVLGVVYLFVGEARTAVKVGGAVWFLAAVYLQFGSTFPLAGLLAQTGLAMLLAVWRKSA